MTLEPQYLAWSISLLGVFLCFSGYKVFKDFLRIWGFIILGILAAFAVYSSLGTSPIGQIPTLLLAFSTGGILGAILALPIYYLSAFLSGAWLGGMVGWLSNPILDPSGTGLGWIVTLVLAFIIGCLALRIQKVIIILATGFCGAAFLLSGPLYGLGLWKELWEQLSTRPAPLEFFQQLPILWVGFWLLLGLAGIGFQFWAGKRKKTA